MLPLRQLRPYFEGEKPLILDGGLATELEARGADLSDTLWSARLLRDNPALIAAVHRDYLVAGADCIITASYQATVPGFMQVGMGLDEAERLIKVSAELAIEARATFWANVDNRHKRRRPLIAGSIGPYGAYLADGGEYRGHYALSQADLIAFHRPRWRLLCAAGVDLLACETIPSLAEARALAALFAESGAVGWVSFSARDGQHISDGTPIAQVASVFAELPNVVAVGVNCTSPRWMGDLIEGLGRGTHKPIIIYANSGEGYDPQTKSWYGERDPFQYADQAQKWLAAGAAAIGGCCRTTPEHISRINKFG